MTCGNCNVVSIQGVPCHETGCPDSWIDPATGEGYPVPCWECGCDYTPEERGSKYSLCVGCLEDEFSESHLGR